MWEIIVKIWNWFGVNSGQVQIIIAIVALILAYVVYKKVLEQLRVSLISITAAQNQLEHSLDQAIINDQHKFVDKKNDILKMAVNDIEKINKSVLDINYILADLVIFINDKAKSLNGTTKEDIQTFNKMKERMSKFKNELENINDEKKNKFKELVGLSYQDKENLDLIMQSILSEKIQLVRIYGVTHLEKQHIKLFMANLYNLPNKP